MIIAVLKVTLRAPWVHSLKEKRSELKSLLARLRNTFNVSVGETDAQDVHQTLVITVAAVAADHRQADSIMDSVEKFIEGNTDAEVIAVEREER
jgi:uncharacterized protein YlxP (DUF503 family)